MAETSCTPCEINELQAWKCMMDSMVRFIQASTKLMGAFNDKPYEDRICHKDCKSYNPNKIPKCKKCTSIDFTDERDKKISEYCHEKCAICIPKQSSKCKCPIPLLSKLLNETEKSEPSFQPREVNEDQIPDQYTEMSLSAKIPTGQTTEDTFGFEILQDTEQFSETAAPIASELPLDDTTESKAIYVDQAAYATKENLQSQWENETKKVGKREVAKRETFEVNDSCICDDLRKKEEEEKLTEDATKCKCGYDVKEICSCPLSSVEKLELTEKMATKLQVAQDEIDELKKELYQLQFTELTKHNKSAALYKEIMKGSALDSSFGRPGTAHSTLRDQSRTLQKPSSSVKRLPSDKTQTAALSYQQLFTGKNAPVLTSSLLDKDTSHSATANWQKSRTLPQKSQIRCSERESACFRRKQQNQPCSMNKLSNYQQSDYRANQQYSEPLKYCTDQYSYEQQSIICPAISGKQQTQPPRSYQAQQSYINYNYEYSDDDSCNDDYNCGYDDCDKYRSTVLF
ncbi:uncharacterized protein [Diabrotica undecimpunctata]|uniref:uncharacterized protein isoform X2 n=1 Tax=Diabrotica undecimpunctata TaxID=50387 RepID=UPI003B633AD2